MPVLEHDVALKLDRILLATNFKPESAAAEAFAQGLAAYCLAKVTVAYAVELSVVTRSEAAVAGLPIKEARHNSAVDMESLLERFQQAGITAHGQVLESHAPGAAIVGLANQLHADAIVIGTEARRGLRKVFAGSCAEDVIRHAMCPVFTLGPKASKVTIGPSGVKNVIFATDLRHDVIEKAHIALNFAKRNAAKIYLFHVTNETKTFEALAELQLSAEAKLRKLIPEPAFEWGCPRVDVAFGEAASRILDLGKRVDADLIVLGAQRSVTWFPHLTRGVVDQVLAEAECPVMTICTD